MLSQVLTNTQVVLRLKLNVKKTESCFALSVCFDSLCYFIYAYFDVHA